MIGSILGAIPYGMTAESVISLWLLYNSSDFKTKKRIINKNIIGGKADEMTIVCDFLDLLMCAKYNTDIPAHLFHYFDLRPYNNLSDIYSISTLFKDAKRYAHKFNRRKVLTITVPSSDDEFQLLFPPRTKRDLSQRVTRYNDVPNITHDEINAVNGTHYIHALCSLRMHRYIATGSGWLKFWFELGVFTMSYENSVSVMKFVSNQVKKRGLTGIPENHLCENGVLHGYMFPPVEGFDQHAEAEKLANGGHDQDDVNGSFTAILKEVVSSMLPRPRHSMIFDRMIDSFDWTTGGASSVGRVSVLFDGDELRFKARKTTVPLCVPLSELYAMKYDPTQNNTSSQKVEPAKIRIVVGSPLPTYLQMSYVMSFMGDGYKFVDYSSLGENSSGLFRRLRKTLDAVKSGWSLPFDYDQFDHQLPLSQLVQMWQAVHDRIRPYVPPQCLKDFDTCFASSMLGIKTATLDMIRVIGSLLSGLYITSLIGNMWNTIKTKQVFAVLKNIVHTRDTVIRGDDTLITTDAAAALYVCRLLYDVFGAEANGDKFSVRRAHGEFLRQTYSAGGVEGYLARTVLSTVQRKPHSSTPWDAMADIRTLVSNTKTAIRRGADARAASDLLERSIDVMSKYTRIDKRWLELPISLGGWGIMPYRGWRSRVVRPRPKVHFTVDDVNDYALGLVKKACGDFFSDDINVDDAVQEMKSTIISLADVHPVNTALRHKFREAWRNHRDDWFYVEPKKRIVSATSNLASIPVATIDSFTRPPPKHGYALLSKHKSRWDAAVYAVKNSRIRPRNLWQAISKHVPDLVTIIDSRSGHTTSRGCVMAWLFGDIEPVATSSPLPDV